jgi:hypothetical protein
MTSRAATSDTTVRRWARPAGTTCGSMPTAVAAYDTPTRARDASADALSSQMGRERMARHNSNPASGMLTNATSAAYRWISPDIDSDSPGRSVRNPPTSSRPQLHTPTSSAAHRSVLDSRTASTAEPAATSDSDAGRSHPCGAKTYSLIMSCSGSRPASTCSATMPATPKATIAYPKSISMPHHDGDGDGGGPSEIHPSHP